LIWKIGIKHCTRMLKFELRNVFGQTTKWFLSYPEVSSRHLAPTRILPKNSHPRHLQRIRTTTDYLFLPTRIPRMTINSVSHPVFDIGVLRWRISKMFFHFNGVIGLSPFAWLVQSNDICSTTSKAKLGVDPMQINRARHGGYCL